MSYITLFKKKMIKKYHSRKKKLRKYQIKLWDDFIESGLNLAYSATRRGGKDLGILSNVDDYCVDNPRSYIVYLFITQEQAVSMVNGHMADDNKTPYLGGVVGLENLKATKNNNYLHNGNTLVYENGSKIIFTGIGNYLSKTGTNVDMLVFSEAGLMGSKFKEIADTLISNMILTGGKIIAISTPRLGSGFNKIFTDNDLSWIKFRHPHNELFKDDGTPIFTENQISSIKLSMSKSRFKEDYEVDMETASSVSIYGESMELVKFCKELEIIENENLFVSQDLGISDATALHFGVKRNNKCIIIHTYENAGKPTQHYINYINNFISKYGFKKEDTLVILPHDALNRHDALTNLVSRASFYIKAGFKIIRLKPQLVKNSIECLKASIEHGDIAWENTLENKKSITKIKEYEYKEVNGINSYIPKHGIGMSASNLADSLEYMAIYFFFIKYIDSKKDIYFSLDDTLKKINRR